MAEFLRQPTSPGPIPPSTSLDESAGPVPIAPPSPSSAQEWISASQELLDQLQHRWADLKQRMESSASAAQRSLAAELNEDAGYIKARARYYHERKPLETLGAVAASAFVLGLIFGFWRR